RHMTRTTDSTQFRCMVHFIASSMQCVSLRRNSAEVEVPPKAVQRTEPAVSLNVKYERNRHLAPVADLCVELKKQTQKLNFMKEMRTVLLLFACALLASC